MTLNQEQKDFVFRALDRSNDEDNLYRYKMAIKKHWAYTDLQIEEFKDAVARMEARIAFSNKIKEELTK